jgi:hypothetical protein
MSRDDFLLQRPFPSEEELEGWWGWYADRQPPMPPSQTASVAVDAEDTQPAGDA